jgi:hypothetical protein
VNRAPLLRRSLIAIACLLALHVATAQTPESRVSLRDVLARVGDYVVNYGEALATVLAEEHYTQQLTSYRELRPLAVRRLRSEIVFVRLADTNEWAAFRNVTNVDGQEVPDADGRLERLFSHAPPTLLAQTRLIASESARYNLGPLTREINIPTLALRYLHPENQSQSQFDKTSEDTINGVSTWVVRFRERDGGGFIRRDDGRRLPAEGRFWIVPADGRILKSQLIVRDFVRGGRDSRAEINVAWRWDAPLNLWVPSEMRETYRGPWTPLTTPFGPKPYDIDGVAQYSNYRRFRVDVLIR